MNLTKKILISGLTMVLPIIFGLGCDETKPKPKPIDTIKNQIMHEGVNISSWWYDNYLSSEAQKTLEKMHDLGVESISVLTTQYQDTRDSTDIYPLPLKTPMDSGIERIVSNAKSLGMRTVLKPHLDVRDGSWRGFISFSTGQEWSDWFQNYNDFIIHYAELAERNDVDLLVIGTELVQTTQRPEWNQVIDNIRAVYQGEIVYCANHDNYQNIPFWDRLDYIGVSAYFPLTNLLDPTPQELETACLAVAQDLENFSNLHNKKIMINEIGYQSYDGTNITPWDAPTRIIDEGEQADCFDAAFKAFFNKDWIAGIYVWDIHYDMQDLDGFSFINKIGELVMNDWYHRMD